MTTKSTRKGHALLWIGLAMIAAAFVLALVGSLYAGRTGTFSGPAGNGLFNAPAGPERDASGSDSLNQGAGETAGGEEGMASARDAVERALQGYGNSDLEVAEVMEFANNYYVEVREGSTGIGAMELLVDKRTGRVHPEPGPNMMWNTKYGMMSGGRGMMGQDGGMMGGSFQTNPQADPNNEMPVSAEQATEIANDYLGRVSPETEAGEVETFYGYYTLHTEQDGEITGMLSVNGYSGEAWYHSWHGPFVAMEESEEH